MFDNTLQKPSFVLEIIKELTSKINGVCSTHGKFERESPLLRAGEFTTVCSTYGKFERLKIVAITCSSAIGRRVQIRAGFSAPK